MGRSLIMSLNLWNRIESLRRRKVESGVKKKKQKSDFGPHFNLK